MIKKMAVVLILTMLIVLGSAGFVLTPILIFAGVPDEWSFVAGFIWSLFVTPWSINFLDSHLRI